MKELRLERWQGVLIVILAILVGMYPIVYLFMDEPIGLLATKPIELLKTHWWTIAFYLHVATGAWVLLTGWTQFVSKWRERCPAMHRGFGWSYVLGVFISAVSGIIVATQATGGMISTLGFTLLALFWLFSTIRALLSAIQNDFAVHQKWMIYSYAATFAAVTLRIYLPILTAATGDFITGYQMVAWLCWVPNLWVASRVVKRLN